MSLDNFKPTVWSALIIDSLRKSLVFGDGMIVNRNYEGEIRNGGEKVKIMEIGDITVSDYTGTVTYQDLQDASKFLEVDQKKYFAFDLDDVDAAQANVELMVRATDKASYKLRDTADQFLAGLYGEAGVTSSLGTTASPLTITSDTTNTSVKNLFSRIAKALDEANCPTEGRWIVVPPWLHQKIVLAEDARLTVENAATTNGRVGSMFGFDVRMSNNVATVSSGSVYKVMAGTNAAISYAEQIVKVEALRRDGSFAEGVRGLHVYGGKVVQNDCLAVASVSEGTT